MDVREIDFGRVAMQGDLLVQAVPNGEIPREAKPVLDRIVAHSETGHHHVAENCEVFAMPDGLTLYLRAIGKSAPEIVHKRDYDTHKTIRLLDALGKPRESHVWKITRQQERTPQGWRRVED